MDQRTKWTQVVEALNETTLNQTDNAIFNAYQDALRAIKKQAKAYLDNYDVLSFAQRLEAERLLAVGDQIKGILNKTSSTVVNTIKQGTAEQLSNSYYGTYYAIEGANNLNMPVAMLDNGYIDTVVNQPVEGKTLSRRLYQNRDRLAKTATRSLLQGAIDGKGYAYVAKRIEDQTEADYKRALRIARTEGGRASSLATQRAYEEAEEAGLDLQKTWVSTLDKKTRHSHQELDGQTVPIDDDFVSPITGAKGKGPRLLGRASEDINCRCTTITVVNGISPELRRDNETGETIQNMSYNEWMENKGIAKTTPKVAAPKSTVTFDNVDSAKLKRLRASADETLDKLEDAEFEAVSTYTDEGYAVNHYIREAAEGKTMPPKWAEYKDTLKSALNKGEVPDNIRTYRVMSQEELDALKLDDTFREFKSTAIDRSRAVEMMNDIGAELIVPFDVQKGTKGLYIDELSQYGENELLLNIDNKYEVKRKDDEWVIEITSGGTR